MTRKKYKNRSLLTQYTVVGKGWQGVLLLMPPLGNESPCVIGTATMLHCAVGTKLDTLHRQMLIKMKHN